MSKYDMIKIGDWATFTKTITDADIVMFAGVTGDTNPVHIDEKFASGTMFKQRIAHGMLTGGLISTVLGTKLPGPGSIYLSQTLTFKAPVFIGDTITARVEVTKKNDDKKIITFKTECLNQDEKVVVSGEAKIMFRD